MSGRMDVFFEQIDVEFFGYFEFKVDGFCNYRSIKLIVFIEEFFIDKVNLLIFIVFELIVFLGGLCVLDINIDGSKNGVFINCSGQFINDFFINLLDMNIKWQVLLDGKEFYVGNDCNIGQLKWIGICVDFVFGFNLELRVIVEVYVSSDVQEKFINDFVVVWNKVMNLD